MLIPGTTLATTVGKDGSIYVADTSNLGHYNSGGNSQIVQYLPNAVGNSGVENSYSTPAFYNGYVYYSGQNDVLKQYQLQSGRLSAGAKSSPPVTLPTPRNSVSWPRSIAP